MVEIAVRGDRVHFEVQGWDKFWALKTELEIPLSHIKSVRADPDAARGWWKGFRLPGTNIPGVLTAGTFYQGDGFVFYDVHNYDNTIVFELDHEHYRRMVVEVADPGEAVSMIEKALSPNVG
ncbi:MAG: hypothetical protein ABR582_03810 [Gemmatimonadaceae bacterium]